ARVGHREALSLFFVLNAISVSARYLRPRAFPEDLRADADFAADFFAPPPLPAADFRADAFDPPDFFAPPLRAAPPTHAPPLFADAPEAFPDEPPPFAPPFAALWP